MRSLKADIESRQIGKIVESSRKRFEKFIFVARFELMMLKLPKLVDSRLDIFVEPILRHKDNVSRTSFAMQIKRE